MSKAYFKFIRILNPLHLLILFFSLPAVAELNIDCTTINETAYYGVNDSQPIEVVTVNGILVSKSMLPAFNAMYHAAKNDGVTLQLVSGFRTMAQQRYLYDCYDNRIGDQCPSGCSSCNVAAVPGTSNHQNGTAVDIETNRGTNQAYQWLRNHAYDYGFNDNYNPPEPWHWVYQNPQAFPDPCGPSGLVEYSATCSSADIEGAEQNIFKDVLPSMTGSDAVNLVFEAGITRGCSERHFCPNCLTDRAMMVTFVMRALGVSPDAYSTSRFSDVAAGSYYLPYVEAAAEMGIINGCSTTTFCPHDLVTREEVAKILINAIGAPLDPPSTPSFTDIDPNRWSYPYIEALNSYCITTGCAPGEFCPQDPVSRIHAAIFIARAFDLQNYNQCINRCDDSQCQASSFCEPWSQCTAETSCVETGVKQRSCHDYQCVGPEMNATCELAERIESSMCAVALNPECEMVAGEEVAGEMGSGVVAAGEMSSGVVTAGETNDLEDATLGDAESTIVAGGDPGARVGENHTQDASKSSAEASGCQSNRYLSYDIFLLLFFLPLISIKKRISI